MESSSSDHLQTAMNKTAIAGMGSSKTAQIGSQSESSDYSLSEDEGIDDYRRGDIMLSELGIPSMEADILCSPSWVGVTFLPSG